MVTNTSMGGLQDNVLRQMMDYVFCFS